MATCEENKKNNKCDSSCEVVFCPGVDPFEDGSLEHTLQEIADLTGATFEQVDKWAKTIDEDRFVSESVEELANEFADQL